MDHQHPDWDEYKKYFPHYPTLHYYEIETWAIKLGDMGIKMEQLIIDETGTLIDVLRNNTHLKDSGVFDLYHMLFIIYSGMQIMVDEDIYLYYIHQYVDWVPQAICTKKENVLRGCGAILGIKYKFPVDRYYLTGVTLNRLRRL